MLHVFSTNRVKLVTRTPTMTIILVRRESISEEHDNEYKTTHGTLDRGTPSSLNVCRFHFSRNNFD